MTQELTEKEEEVLAMIGLSALNPWAAGIFLVPCDYKIPHLSANVKHNFTYF